MAGAHHAARHREGRGRPLPRQAGRRSVREAQACARSRRGAVAVTDRRQAVTDEALAALLQASLVLWNCPGGVRGTAAGTISVRAWEHTAEIARAEPGVPFRWSIVIDGRRRHAGSIPGLLRTLRMGLDAGFRPSRTRIVPVDAGAP